ncbi:MAG: hypothetical protein WKH97_07955 [Casimicrobiaceae bacterium]
MKEEPQRWQGHGIDDVEVRSSSSLQSYNEMRKGEEFLNGKFVAAPARTRWIAGPITILVELALMPWRRMRLAGDAAKSVAVPNLTFAGVASRDTSMKAG